LTCTPRVGHGCRLELRLVKQAQSTLGTEEDKLSFEQILERLHSVVETLEQGERPLEEALSTFEQGVALARAGARRLDEAERRIEVLLSDEEGVRTRPLHPQDEERSEDE
jgi:exodeoxyribonuclease VII small subunit